LTGADPKFQTQPTSYDYDSPLTEAGDVTDKYMAIRAAVSKFLPIPKVPIPVNSTKVAYGKIAMPFVIKLLFYFKPIYLSV
jgi:beta-galactosidase